MASLKSRFLYSLPSREIREVFTFHFSLFTFHFSLFSFSYFTKYFEGIISPLTNLDAGVVCAPVPVPTPIHGPWPHGR